MVYSHSNEPASRCWKIFMALFSWTQHFPSAGTFLMALLSWTQHFPSAGTLIIGLESHRLSK